MASKNKVSVTSDATSYRLSSNERRAARLAAIANKQSELKREAAERRAEHAKQAAAKGDEQASDERKPAAPRRSYTR